jgi:hypothetical protein
MQAGVKSKPLLKTTKWHENKWETQDSMPEWEALQH